ncbi:MAG: 3',5'-cyclic AMP phosphodiesterase CpdA [Bacteroidia bacterium]|jgi:3',5'-cyclic AMP phosphodiesterase CpdA
MSQSFAQLSDPHLSTLAGVRPAQLLNKRALGYLSWRRRRRFEHQRAVLDALQQDLDLGKLDQLLVTGDLTHIGLPEEFQQGREWLEGLGSAAQVALVPGNHDACIAAPWEQTFALWQDYMASDTHADLNSSSSNTSESNTSSLTTASSGASSRNSFPSLRIRGGIAFIGLSTACPTPPLMATGTAGQEQLAKLPALLEQAKQDGLFRVLYLHHCPVVGQDKWRKRLTDAPDVQALLEQHGVELVVHGHGHREHYVELTTCDGVAPVIAVPSASALGLHGADVARYNHYRVDALDKGWQLQIAQRRYDVEEGVFIAGDSRTVELVRQGN